MESPPGDLVKVLCVKQLSASDAANSKQIKLPKSDARKFVGELRHKQSSSVEVIDSQSNVWTFLCTCYGCQYALSRVGNFCAAYNLKPGQYMVFYLDIQSKLRVSIMRSVPDEWLHKDVRKSPQQPTKPPKAKQLQQAGLPRAALPFACQFPHALQPFFPRDYSYGYPQHVPGAGAAAQPQAPLDALGRAAYLREKQAAAVAAAGLADPRSSFSQLQLHQAALSMFAGKAHGLPPPVETPASKRQRLGEHAAAASASLDSDSTSQHWEAAPQGEALHSDVSSGQQMASSLKQVMPTALPAMEMLPTSWATAAAAAAAGTRPQAESPTSEESNQEFHMPRDSTSGQEQGGKTPASASRAGSPDQGAGATAAAPVAAGMLLNKLLSKMDVACAHDPIGIVFAADAVLASGLLRGSSQQLCFMLKDKAGANHQCKLSLSKNRRFCYLSGLGAFLSCSGAAAGDEVSIQLASTGRLMVSLAPRPVQEPVAPAVSAPPQRYICLRP